MYNKSALKKYLGQAERKPLLAKRVIAGDCGGG
jgi:hypothetical protein